jgi:hypothetical protein
MEIVTINISHLGGANYWMEITRDDMHDDEKRDTQHPTSG